MRLDPAGLARLEDMLRRTLSAYERLLEAGAPAGDLSALRTTLGQLHLRLGQHHHAAGNGAEALRHGQEAQALLPGNRDVAILLVQALVAARQVIDAADFVLADPAFLSEDPGILHLKGKVLLAAGRTADAVTICRQAAELRPGDAVLLAQFGEALLADGRTPEALDALKRATGLAPENAGLLTRYAIVCNDAGAFDEARRAYETLTILQPKRGSHHRMLGLLRAYQPGDPHIEQMERLLAAADPESENARELHFALFRAREAVGEYDRAFGHLKSANDLLAKKLDYRPEITEKLFAGIEAAFPTGREPPAISGRQESPIFIVGMPRSGSTLTEQILASHPDVVAVGETPAFAAIVERHFLRPDLAFDLRAMSDRVALEALGEDYLAAIGATQGRRTVDKYLTNFLSAGFIRAIFPKARIVHCHRDPLANCFAIYASYFETDGLRFKADMREVARYYARYRRLMNHWHRLFPEAVHDLSYERLTEDQEGETRRLLGSCGLDWHPACLDFHRTERQVKTASFIQVRKPLYSGADRRTGRYLAHLGPMVRVLAEAGLHPFEDAA